ncbi:MAG: endonuclease domain-containing protein [bacterium]|nr:endonuclease domain-containing protein [bacterium]
MSELHKGTSKTLFQLAKENRKNPTEAESKLWRVLRDNRFEGYKFRRQHPMSNYILDFYCHQLKIVVEVDGGYHQKTDQKKYDESRDEYLMELGIEVIRFTNDRVLKDLDEVMRELSEFINTI